MIIFMTQYLFNLFKVWILISGFHHTNYYMFWNHNFVVLLSSLRGGKFTCRHFYVAILNQSYTFLKNNLNILGLSLVVAKFLDEWIHGILPVYLLCPLLCNQVRNWGSSIHVSVYWIYIHDGVFIFPLNR